MSNSRLNGRQAVRTGILLSGFCFLYLAPARAVSPAAITTLYINKYFEVRDHDAPTKYVWNGDTRVARVTGSLSTNQRVQHLRLYTGWNLISLAVTATNFLSQTLNSGVQIAAYRWVPQTATWSPVAAGDTVPSGAVLWLSSPTNAEICLLGDYALPTNGTLPAGGTFVPSAGLEAWATSNLVSAGSAWMFDAQAGSWLTKPAASSDAGGLPDFIAPGAAVYVQAAAPAQLSVPDSALRVRYYHQDHLLCTVSLTDAGGGVIEETANYPFGYARHSFRPRGEHEAYQFSQKETDAETGLDYFEKRYCNALGGQFLSPDRFMLELPAMAQHDELLEAAYRTSLRQPQRWNLYAYAQRNPLKFVDTTGQWTRLVLEASRWDKTFTPSGQDRSLFNKAINLIWYTQEGRQLMKDQAKIRIDFSKGPVQEGGFAETATKKVIDSVWFLHGRAQVRIDFDKLAGVPGLTLGQRVRLLADMIFHEMLHVQAELKKDYKAHELLDAYHFPSLHPSLARFESEARPPVAKQSGRAMSVGAQQVIDPAAGEKTDPETGKP